MKKTALITLALAAIAASALAWQNSKTVQAPRTQANRTAQVEWIRTDIGSSEMSVELPGKATKQAVPLSEDIRKRYDVLETMGYKSDSLAAFVSYAVSREQKISLDNAARGALDRIKENAGEDYKETISSVQVAGIPARKLQCSFSAGDKKMALAGLIFADRNRMWQVICTYDANATNVAIANRILASIKKNPAGSS